MYHMAVIHFFLLTNYVLGKALPPSSPSAPPAPSGAQCSEAQEWLIPTFNDSDCVEAVNRFFYTDYYRFRTTRYEFHNRGTPDSTRYPRKILPRRYTIATCTVVIAMLWDFPTEPPLPPLPGEPSGPFKKVDVMSFQQVFESLRRVTVTCGEENNYMGWEAMGRDLSVGVFVMATGSELERNIRIGVEPSMVAAGRLLNSSSSTAATGGLLNSFNAIGGGTGVQIS